MFLVSRDESGVVPPSRRYLLAGLLAGIALVTAAMMWQVLPTVFFALTIAYVLVPFVGWIQRRGYSRWIASVVATTGAMVAIVLLFLPIAAVLYFRRRQLLAVINAIPDEIPIVLGDFVYTLDVSTVITFAQSYVTDVAIGIARATPIIAAKAILFVFVIFGFLVRRDELTRALFAPLPPDYHDIAHAFGDRIRETLRALYVTQAATGFGTFLIALPVFWVLGYGYAVTLAVLAGILQFLPVIGPSLVVLAVAAGEVLTGAYLQAASVLVFGLLLVGFLPDAVIRPRLARETAHMPASLYFVGFTGGVLSLGFVGIIAGPLAVALLLESLSLLAAEMNHERIPAHE